jgi:hypothetical protein
VDAAELIAVLRPYTDVVGGYGRTVAAETRHRRYRIVGIHADDDGDPIIDIEFDDRQDGT